MFPLLLLATLAAEPAVAPKYEIKAMRGEIAVADAGRRLEVTSEFGIGRAMIRLVEGQWPAKLTFLLKLKELEGVTLRNDRLELRTNRRAEQVEIREKEGEAWKDAGIQKEPRITIRGDAGKIEVEVPAALLRPDVRQIEIEWVDYYRG
jgi:hypothetical protein